MVGTPSAEYPPPLLVPGASTPITQPLIKTPKESVAKLVDFIVQSVGLSDSQEADKGALGDRLEVLRTSLSRLLLVTAFAAGCGSADIAGDLPGSPQVFGNPERVSILDYRGEAMEPFVSRDGRHLFFNNRNDPAVDTNLHWAERLDDLTFRYRGELGGVNTPALEAVPSMDRHNVLYFVSTRSYAQTASTLYRGSFADGTVSRVGLVPGVSTATAGIVIFDAEISPDGNTLYFVESEFGPGGPRTADILIAERSGGDGFVPASGASSFMREINTQALEYAPAISASGLEIFFTRLDNSGPAIYTATRTSAAAPFGAPQRVQAISGFVEGPTLSPDERSLYYHKKEDVFVIYRVTRP